MYAILRVSVCLSVCLLFRPNAETTHWIDPHLSCVQKQDPGKCDDDGEQEFVVQALRKTTHANCV